jgi:hypothetical protein
LVIIQYVTTTPDRNGNSRRGWMLHEVDEAGPHVSRELAMTPDYLGYVDEGGRGPWALSEALRVAYGDKLPRIVTMPHVELRPGDHRDIRNGRRFGA